MAVVHGRRDRSERLADELADRELRDPGRHALAAVGGGDSVLVEVQHGVDPRVLADVEDGLQGLLELGVQRVAALRLAAGPRGAEPDEVVALVLEELGVDLIGLNRIKSD